MKGVLIILLLVVICGLFGSVYHKVWKQKNSDLLTLLLEGGLLFFCTAGVLVMPFIKLRASFTIYCLLLAVTTIVIGLSGCFLILTKRIQISWRVEGIRQGERLSFVLAGIVLAALAASFWIFAPSVGADLTAESIFMTVQTDTLYEYNPATGRSLEIGIYPQSKLVILPVFYSVLYRLAGGNMQFFLYRLIPLTLLCLHLLIVWRWSGILWAKEQEKQQEKRGLFLLFYGVLVLFGDYSNTTIACRLMHETWKGESILAVLLLPYLALVCMKVWQEGHSWKRLADIGLCFVAGIFIAPWKLAVLLEGLTVLCFLIAYLIGRCRRWLKLRRL